MDLNTLAFVLLGIMVSGYAILDGFDLGVGALSLFADSQEERTLQVASIGPFWDGNQVWLLTAGNVLFGAFPLLFATVFSGLYPAFMLLLASLAIRAVSIEFRIMHSSPRWTRMWDLALGASCLSSSVLLGISVGNVLRGLPLGAGFTWEGSLLEMMNPYAVFMGFLSSVVFIMHGAIYLWMKVEGELCERYRRTALTLHCVFLLMCFVAVASTLYVSPLLGHNTETHILFGGVLLLVAALASTRFAIRGQRKGVAFLASSATIAIMIFLVAVCVYPHLIYSTLDPTVSLTIYNAASMPGTLVSMLSIAVIGLPVMLGYTFLVYRVFRGPIKPH